MSDSPERFTLIAGRAAGSPEDALARDVLRGFARSPKELPPSYFYDEAGAAIYEEITRLDEYYLTRAEETILREQAVAIARRTRARELLELGPGSASKALLLAKGLREAASFDTYLPVDCCEPALRSCARDVLAAFPEARVHAVHGAFDEASLAGPPRERRLVAFLGSTVGNLEDGPAIELLGSLRQLAGPDGFVLLGADLMPGPTKSRQRLELAYDDPAGVTARFNMNVLHVMNRRLAANFRPEDFRHRAPYVEAARRIEMHLVAQRPVTIRFERLSREYRFEEGELLRTEISCKYDRPCIEGMLAAAGLELVEWMTDPAGWFALSLSRPR